LRQPAVRTLVREFADHRSDRIAKRGEVDRLVQDRLRNKCLLFGSEDKRSGANNDHPLMAFIG